MNKEGPIVIIDDDLDDMETLKDVFKNLDYNNEILFFHEGEKAIEYLTSTNIMPFLILSDINLPKISGSEIRQRIKNHPELKIKSIPFIYFTGGALDRLVIEAYSDSIQGYFLKRNTFEGVENMVKA